METAQGVLHPANRAKVLPYIGIGILVYPYQGILTNFGEGAGIQRSRGRYCCGNICLPIAISLHALTAQAASKAAVNVYTAFTA